MSKYRTNSGQNVVYQDFSTSSIAEPLVASTVVPFSLVGFRQNSIFPKRMYVQASPTEEVEIEAVLDLDRLSPDERELYLYNLKQSGEEPEDVIIAKSAVPQKLLQQAMEEPPIDEWEQHLDRL